MRLGTMTTLFRDRREGPEHYGYIESIRRCRAAGFTVLDMNLCALSRRQTTLHLDDWKQQVDEIRNEAEKQGCVFSQSHPPYRRGGARFDTQEEEDFFGAMELRAIEITAMLGAKWAVIHPITAYDGDPADPENNIRWNKRIFAREIELADKLGVGLAFENMCDNGQRRRFCVTAEELIALTDSFHSDKIGVCWDVGHANRTYDDQIPAILKLGERIKALHIDDNRGKDDLHVLPFEGTIPWERVMHALYESGSPADLIFEVSTNNRMPEALKDLTARYHYDVGQYLLSLYK